MIVNRTHATVRGRVIAAYPINNTAGGDAVLNFRLAANERQFDPATNTWNDKDTFYVTVSCWTASPGARPPSPCAGRWSLRWERS
jgi:single-strand DNA-binding protein